MQPRVRPGWIVTGITLFGAVLRLYHLGDKSLWVDESNLYWITRGSLAQVLHANAGGNSAPPLFAVALALVSRLGDSEAALRAVSCVAGIAALPVIYLLARELLPVAGALVTTLLAALSPGQVLYSQQVREYSLAVLFTALILLCFIRFLRQPSWRAWLALSATLATGMFVQYGIGLLAVALNLVFALEWIAGRVPRAAARRWALAQLPALAAAALVARLSLRQQFDPHGFGAHYLTRGYWDGAWGSLPTLVVANTYDIFFLAYPTALLLEFLAILGAVFAWRRRETRVGVLLFAATMSVTLAAACLRYYPYLGMRQCLFLTVMIYVLAGLGVQALLEVERRGVVAVGVTAWLGLQGLIGTWEHLQSTQPFHLRPAVELLQAHYQPGDRIYVYHGAVSPFLYYDRAAPHEIIHGVYSPGDGDAYRRQLDQILAADGRVWLLLTTCRSGECELIRRHAGGLRQLESMHTAAGAELHLAH